MNLIAEFSNISQIAHRFDGKGTFDVKNKKAIVVLPWAGANMGTIVSSFCGELVNLHGLFGTVTGDRTIEFVFE